MSALDAARARVRARRSAEARKDVARLVRNASKLNGEIETAVKNDKLSVAGPLAFELQSAQSSLQVALATADMEAARAQAAERFGLPVYTLESGEQSVLRPSIIYCDPPWAYESKVHAMGTEGIYDSMSDAEIAALPVAGLASENAALLMWVTLPKLEAAFRIIASWGFTYRTVFLVWDKIGRYYGAPSPSKGHYTRPNHELLLLAIRGSMPTLSVGASGVHATSLRTRPGDHSRKPEVVRKIIVDTFGDLPRIELFARQIPLDWLVWGNEIAGSCTTATAVAANRTVVQAKRNKHTGDMIKRGIVKRHGLLDIAADGDDDDDDDRPRQRGGKAQARPSSLSRLDAYEQWNETTRGTVICTDAPTEAAAEHQTKRQRFEAMVDGVGEREPISAYLSTLDLALAPPLVPHERCSSLSYPTLTEKELIAALPLVRQIQRDNADTIFLSKTKN